MATNQIQTLYLEQWLRNMHSPSPSPSPSPPPSSARAIIHSWSQLRDLLQRQTFKPHHLQTLKTLLNSQTSLHVADPQAKLLLSILSSPNVSPPKSHPLLFRLLYIWLKKSKKTSFSLLESAVSTVSRILSTQNVDSGCVPEAILLLGAISRVPGFSENSKRVCLELLCKLVEEQRSAITSFGELVHEVLAGIGYALVCSDNVYFGRILASMFGIWSETDGSPRTCVVHGILILHLMEWLVSGFMESKSLEKIEFLYRETRNRKNTRFVIVMAASGILRAFNRVASSSSSSRVQIDSRLRNFVEGSISAVASELIPKTGTLFDLGDNFDHNLLVQCISLGLARSGPLSFHAPVLLCLTKALLMEIFPLGSLYSRAVENPHGDSAILVLNEFKEHVGSLLFKEAGAITSALCNQYDLANEGVKTVVENYIWSYCQEIYLKHRRVALVLHRGRDDLLGELERIAEAAFLMVVIFASVVTKQKLNSKSSRETHSDVSARILVAFSCIEYFRRVRLPEYSDAIRRVILSLQENGSACVSFVESMPSYADLTNQQGEMEYIWFDDEVQTARILFYLRVIPTCIERIPDTVFKKIIAPTMFLYMQHPNGKVARASHSVFVAFISSANDSNEDDKLLLKEQLVYYYLQRALEACPGTTPFEGMSSGVAALVRHLPAGSPAIYYCINTLVGKATSLCSKAMTQDADIWKNWKGESEPCKKFLDLLLRLISLVDIQVLPNLLKLLAQLIVQLPKDGQTMVLDEIYSLVAESDDVTRKPILVSWLQSLSYLCSQTTSGNSKNIQAYSSSTTKEGNGEQNNGSTYGTDTLSLNRTRARL